MSEPQKLKSYRLQFTDEERASPELDKYIKKAEELFATKEKEIMTV